MAKSILVVDDEAHIVQVLSLKLRNAGYEVMTAIDGEEAFECARARQPDLVIADYQMPYMTGTEMCAAMLEDPTTAGIPVMILTARGYALGQEDVALANIQEVISKPFSPRGILRKVESVIGAPNAPAEGEAA